MGMCGKMSSKKKSGVLALLIIIVSNDLDIKLVFTTFKLRNLFSVNYSVPRELLSHVIYKFTCACSYACYIPVGETVLHFFMYP